MTRFIVHIGPHKTGTTYLQMVLDGLRGTLLAKSIYIPSMWNAAPELPSHMQLVWAIRDRRLSVIEQQLREMLEQSPRFVVISCEALSRLSQAHVVQLRQLLCDAPVQVVYYVRRWPERLPSLWQEQVKFGDTTTLPEFLSEQLLRPEASELRDASVVDKFAAVFGASQISLVSYGDLTERGVDLAGHFLASFLDLRDIQLPEVGQPNRSLPILDIELIRALNTIHARRGGEESAALRNWFIYRRDGLVPEFLEAAMRDSVSSVRLDEAPFAQLYQDLLTRYASSLVPPHHADGLHELRALDVAYVRQDYLLQPALVNAVTGIYNQYVAPQ